MILSCAVIGVSISLFCDSKRQYTQSFQNKYAVPGLDDPIPPRPNQFPSLKPDEDDASIHVVPILGTVSSVLNIILASTL
jgi:hypothetical protein